jgi:hypothetical protein
MVSADRRPDRSAGSDTLLPFGFGRPRLPSLAITSSYPSQASPASACCGQAASAVAGERYG